MALFEIIQKKKTDNNIIWRYPKNNFNTSSQLIVHEGQEAIFLSNGKILDVFNNPGRYTLTTDNLPILKTLVGLTTGFRKPFQCEVYFIDTTEKSEKWGTNSKIQIIEPIYGFPLEIGACGEYRFNIANSKNMLTKLVGISKKIKNEDIEEFFLAFINLRVKAYLSQIIKEKKISVFEMDQKIDMFSQDLEIIIKKDFINYGINLEKFIITNIAKPEDDRNYQEYKTLFFDKSIGLSKAEINQKIELIQKHTDVEKIKMEAEAKATKRNIEGYSYQEERKYDIGKEVAKNEAIGEFTNMGVGLGMVTGIGNSIGNEVNSQVLGALSNDEKVIICPNCNIVNDNNAKFCKECGQILNKIKTCPRCGKKIEKNDKFCSNCGERIDVNE